jgi:hypothetical protein
MYDDGIMVDKMQKKRFGTEDGDAKERVVVLGCDINYYACGSDRAVTL